MSTHAIAERRPAHHYGPVSLLGAVQFATEHYLLLPAGAALALLWANAAPESYFTLAHALAFPVNEILMALFVAVATQELIEATMAGGALHQWRRWLLPVAGAAGGVAGAALSYLAFVNWKYELMLRDGWPVATAVDLAFAYFVVKSIFRRHAAIPFLLLLGIATTLFGTLAIAFRGPAPVIVPGAAALMALAIGTAAVLRHLRVHAIWPYLCLAGPLSWLALYLDGLHPALALVPIVPFMVHAPRGLELFNDPAHSVHDSPTHLEHALHHPVHVVLFLFGLVNGGVLLAGYGTGTWATVTAAMAGRSIGIFAAVALAVAAGLRLPGHLRWRELAVVSLAASCGFTFALFFAVAIYPAGPLLTELKIGALLTVGGVVAAAAVAKALRVGRFGRHGGHAHPIHHHA